MPSPVILMSTLISLLNVKVDLDSRFASIRTKACCLEWFLAISVERQLRSPRQDPVAP